MRNMQGLRRQLGRRAMRGYLMVELALVLAITTIMTAAQFSQLTNAFETSQAVATGQYMVELQSGVNLALLTNMAAISKSNPVTGFANPLKPTVAELIAGGYLNAGFAAVSPLGLSFNISMSLSNCPGAHCTVSGQAYSSLPYTDATGSLRSDLLTSSVSTIGIDGSQSMTGTPSQLTGFGGGGPYTNPAGAVAGILAIKVGSGSGITALLSQYYKLDGTTPLAGTMDANNNDIIGLNNVQINGTGTLNNLVVTGETMLSNTAAAGSACTAAQNGSFRTNANQPGMVLCNAGLWAAVGNAVAGISDGGACSLAGQMGTTEAGVAYGCNGSYWSPLQVSANPGDACAPTGKVAMSIATREQLICKNGSFIKFSSLIASNVEVSRQTITDGLVVTKPTCDTGGTPAYSFIMTQTVVDVSVIPPRQALYLSATDNGASWIVNIRLHDNSSGDFSANAYGVTEVMKLECSY